MSQRATDLASKLDPFRLPTSARPGRYDVRLRPLLADASFDGTVTIQLEVDDRLDVLVLNAAELEIRSCRVDDVEAAWELHEESERLMVWPAEPLLDGHVKLTVDFVGVLNDKLRGFYRSTYVDADGGEQVVATTQMQATDCRRAFPCWDEPEFKAVFGVTLDIDDELTAISNGPEIERISADGRSVVRFADTMVMSTYLVAFVVGRLEATEPVDVDGTPMRVVHVPGKSHLTDFGLDVGRFCLQWFQDFYGIEYPSDKVDLVALPDFAAGAMENLGCITFRESLLLVDPGTSTQTEQQLVADVVAHELAHMWFGDLVTMRWWNGIWLNEAFATFMEIAACEAYRPDWKRWTSFGSERSGAFDVDALENTRSVEFEVRSPADCEGMFDVLTYQKGGALLRMLEQYLGTERFREGVNHYLRMHSYRNTDTNDLWDAIEATSGEPVRRIMDSWIWQPGFPQLTATATGEGRLRLEQQRFRSTPDGSGTQIWAVPVHVRNGGSTHTVLLDGESIEIELEDPHGVVVVNAGGHGFYRVAYDGALRSRLGGDALSSLDTLERYSLVDDAWSATVAGQMGSVEMLEFLEGFEGERDLAVWQAIVLALRGLGRLVGDAAMPAFQQRVRSIVEPALDVLGEPSGGESDLDGKLRGLLVGVLGVLGGHEPTRQRCRDILAASTERDDVDPELIAAATSVVAATGDADDFDRMQSGFLEAVTPQEQLRHLYALAEFDDEDLVLRACDFAFSGSVRTQNAPFLLRLAIANRRHGASAWTYVRDHWQQALDTFPSNTIVRMVDTVRLLTSPEQVDDVQSFFADHPIEQAAKTLEQILERQRVNAALSGRESARFAAVLLQR